MVVQWKVYHRLERFLAQIQPIPIALFASASLSLYQKKIIYPNQTGFFNVLIIRHHYLLKVCRYKGQVVLGQVARQLIHCMQTDISFNSTS